MMWVDPQLCLNYSWAFWLWELISSLPCLGEFELNLCHLQPQESCLKQRHKQNRKSRTWNLFSAQQKTKYATFDNDVISLPSIGFSSYPGKKATIHTWPVGPSVVWPYLPPLSFTLLAMLQEPWPWQSLPLPLMCSHQKVFVLALPSAYHSQIPFFLRVFLFSLLFSK